MARCAIERVREFKNLLWVRESDECEPSCVLLCVHFHSNLLRRIRHTLFLFSHSHYIALSFSMCMFSLDFDVYFRSVFSMRSTALSLSYAVVLLSMWWTLAWNVKLNVIILSILLSRWLKYRMSSSISVFVVIFQWKELISFELFLALTNRTHNVLPK